ncbi:hypothetical protein ACFQ48_09885 [Hymenobacter caeli]|uniref:Translation initiation factor IF-2 n=1 Tax=Hymenobacter caeli TaxID=2735894 RepID=A0ABX2FPI5_9BACT|nr:hypothetical protein [Hymenobacter caeli]NRT18384.1 hypothetical protein [Hymenobacter caeli]
MKNILSASFAAAALLTAASAFAAPATNQEGPRRPPVAQGPAHYGDHRFDGDYDRGPRPDYRREQDRRAAYRYDRASNRDDRGPRYGYEPAQVAYPQRAYPQPQPQPRRPVAVAIQIHL